MFGPPFVVYVLWYLCVSEMYATRRVREVSWKAATMNNFIYCVYIPKIYSELNIVPRQETAAVPQQPRAEPKTVPKEPGIPRTREWFLFSFSILVTFLCGCSGMRDTETRGIEINVHLLIYSSFPLFQYLKGHC